eukprot:CAMPEP_0174732160 /NCGR_PEP_ID=MMETSP1094-20130205/58889_1 /TAXON_ID=156173 /ORGANISM="Chrysochromulina brevifilum, Strain UTEX LB 985" /LENGTH=53 /DNA_ID=CAMNT_0015934641 /DNA_START=171 /DNA_END=332 /DNA_ORIENTATION=-
MVGMGATRLTTLEVLGRTGLRGTRLSLEEFGRAELGRCETGRRQFQRSPVYFG